MRVAVVVDLGLRSQDRFSNQALVVRVSFTPVEFAIDLTVLTVIPITCSPLDASWGFKLPSVQDSDQENAKISVEFDPKDSNQKLFSYDDSFRAV